ncbi:ataxin-10-like [Dioscorea cayenensis subsp. rotundata]|uniref:Ataxin-10-like n=1 Tax=Dioscorea cayennensis subsp. rotundata TaxID=55577 RepID=A0AB40AV19_DIOCR|nr:ataxin-10-like [Dioscorea cayenensis subsp. rotundata]
MLLLRLVVLGHRRGDVLRRLLFLIPAILPSTFIFALESVSLKQNPYDFPMDLETLASHLEASRTLGGRGRLAVTGTLDATLRGLSPSSPLLLPHLRLLRNLCAGEPANQDAFLRFDGPDRILPIVLSSPPDGVRVGLQVLCNVALAGEEHRAKVWARLFPVGFLELARICDRGILDPLCMLLDTCCSADGGRRRLGELCEDEKGLPILIEIITTACTAKFCAFSYDISFTKSNLSLTAVGYQEEWLEWLLSKVCIEEQYFFMLFQKLGQFSDSNSCNDIRDEHTVFSGEQAFLLRLMSNCLSERPNDFTISDSFALSVLRVLKEASCAVNFNHRGNSPLPTGSPAIDVLGYALNILRDICASDDPLSAPKASVDSLISSGLLQLLLCFLSELEPPSTIKKSMANGTSQMPTMADALKVCPYKGFRRDVVSVISNCLYRRKQVQDEIRRKNGIPLLLQQCVVDEDNPFLREWGLMAVRNLLEGNTENQREVAQLELQGTVNTTEIAELGLRVEAIGAVVGA